jgi:hypothetical protein
MSKRKKIEQIASELQLIAGVEKHFTKGSLLIGGKTYMPKQVVRILQARVDAANAVLPARAALRNLVLRSGSAVTLARDPPILTSHTSGARPYGDPFTHVSRTKSQWNSSLMMTARYHVAIAFPSAIVSRPSGVRVPIQSRTYLAPSDLGHGQVGNACRSSSRVTEQRRGSHDPANSGVPSA